MLFSVFYLEMPFRRLYGLGAMLLLALLSGQSLPAAAGCEQDREEIHNHLNTNGAIESAHACGSFKVEDIDTRCHPQPEHSTICVAECFYHAEGLENVGYCTWKEGHWKDCVQTCPMTHSSCLKSSTDKECVAQIKKMHAQNCEVSCSQQPDEEHKKGCLSACNNSVHIDTHRCIHCEYSTFDKFLQEGCAVKNCGCLKQ